MSLCLPGIDTNDPSKTQIALQVFVEFVTSITFVDSSGSEWSRAGLSSGELKAVEDSALLEDLVSQLLDRVLELLEMQVAASSKHYSVEESIGMHVRLLCQHLFRHISRPFVEHACDKLFLWITNHTATVSAKILGHMCGSACRASAKAADRFVPWLGQRILDHAASHPTMLSESANENVVDEPLVWWLHLLARIARRGGPNVLRHRALLLDVIASTLPLASRTASKLGGKLLRHFLRAQVDIYPLGMQCFPEGDAWDPVAHMAARTGGLINPYENPQVHFFIPSPEDIAFTETVLERVYTPALAELKSIATGGHSTWSSLPGESSRLGGGGGRGGRVKLCGAVSK